MSTQKTAFLFPGQGSQSVGMMSELSAHSDLVEATFSEASAVLGYDLWELVENGPQERLNNTEVTQPSLLTAGIATWRVWKSLQGPDPHFMAGHSLGEYTALVAAGALDFAEAIALAAERGRAMQRATPEGSSAMAAILGLDDGALEEICAASAQGQVLSCANYNSPGQVVIAGAVDAVGRAMEAAREAGARRAVPLPVSVASHCELMLPAAEHMQTRLLETDLSVAGIPVVHNVDVRPHASEDDIRDLLVRQLTAPVRWTGTIEWLIGQGVDRFAECGPGKVLTGLNRRISREVETTALVSWDAIIETKANWS